MSLPDHSIEWILLSTGGGMLVIQLLYFLLIFLRVWTGKRTEPDDDEYATPVSVVVAARNEKENLKELIPLLYEQDHPNFDVVVVNDRSWDGSDEILEALQREFVDLHVITIDESQFNQHQLGKKLAITLGIKGAQHEHLIFTDADCRPLSKKWLRYMSAPFTDQEDLVLGYSPVKKRSSFVNLLARFDTSVTAVQYIGYARAGIPYMGVGRNMGYSSDLYYEVGGFKRHYALASGDDDLFVNEASRLTGAYVVDHPESWVQTEAPLKWKAWWRQKRRHMTTGGRYRLIHKFLLITYPVTYLGWLLSGLLLLSEQELWLWGVIVLGTRSLAQWIIFTGSMNRLGTIETGLLAPVLEPLWMLIMFLIQTTNRIRQPNTWK